MYLEQTYRIKGLLYELGVHKVRVTTVDNYQGEENDIIILSLVRSNNNGKIGFIENVNRLCVALSRARLGLFVFGNFQCIAKYCENKPDHLWVKIIALARAREFLVDSIDLLCYSHQYICHRVKSP
jgi:superfamily I DNA and/or RNA helicase